MRAGKIEIEKSHYLVYSLFTIRVALPQAQLNRTVGIYAIKHAD
jgi:hypothetical protein